MSLAKILLLLLFSNALLACASQPISPSASTTVASWPVITEPGYMPAATSSAAAALASASKHEISFAVGSVSLGAGAEFKAPIKNIAEEILQALAQQPQLQVQIVAYASAEKGVERAQTTALYRAQSVYYKLARAGVPKTAMHYQAKTQAATAAATTAASSRRAVISW